MLRTECVRMGDHTYRHHHVMALPNIANPEEIEWADRLYLFNLGGPYTTTDVYVWANDDESAFEIAMEWCDDNAPGILCTLTLDDLKEAAEDLGIPWSEDFTFSGCIEETEGKILDHAEADLTIIGHTTLKNGTHIRSEDWHFCEIHDAALYDAIERVSVERNLRSNVKLPG